jgi:hypothetical protein
LIDPGAGVLAACDGSIRQGSEFSVFCLKSNGITPFRRPGKGADGWAAGRLRRTEIARAAGTWLLVISAAFQIYFACRQDELAAVQKKMHLHANYSQGRG